MRYFIIFIAFIAVVFADAQVDIDDNEDVATIEDDNSPIFLKDGGFSFSRAKSVLAKKVYPSHQEAFYSGCKYIIKDKKLVPIHKTCGFKYRKNENRANRIEWEHIVPAWHFGHQLKCWQNGGRKVCRNTNAKFKTMEADMHNLVPAIGEINGDRSNFRYGIVEGEKRVYGKVDMEIDFANRRAEPKDSVVGDIARAYFYMRDKYGLKISKPQEKLFIAWNNMDPVSSWERKKNEIVKEIQGNNNPYISDYRKLKYEEGATPRNNFNDIKDEIYNKFASIFDKLPKPLAETIVFLIALFVLYKRKSKKKKDTKKETKKTPTPTKNSETKTYMIITKLTNSAISYNEDGEVIIEKVDKSNPKQQWIFPKANKKKKYFFIENAHTGKVIEIEGADSNDGAKIVLGKKKKSKNDHQEWSLEESKDEGFVFIVNRWSLGVLDVKYKKTTDGTKLQNYHKKVRGTENQEWKIIEING